ncbi:MAG TPA: hypothetical protein VFO10_20425 [Oligoflexus sp.]|uniref:hypothetical protein n=1 Tax=Oligoflexus sp. TaxID=1971216 RepID=UPI002D7FEDE5|nr:hypothetical protein [Oligoflexus sp.]HET9239637.1 hypothetical protein [Oligoflexus sp.]
MRNIQLICLLATILLTTACQSANKKRDFYHFASEYGYCLEWVDDVEDSEELPPAVKRGACPQEMTIQGGVKTFRYANCPDISAQGNPEMFVYYSRMPNDDGTTADMTEIPVADICKK